MLSLKVITLAYCIGILWGLYLEFSTLIITSIFLCFLWLIVIKKYNFEFIIMSMVCILGAKYTVLKIKNYDRKYQDDVEINLNITIISQMIEKEYTYKDDGSKVDNEKKENVYYKAKLQSIINQTTSKFEMDGETYTWNALTESKDENGNIQPSIYDYVESQITGVTLAEKCAQFNKLIYIFNDDPGIMNSEFDYVVNLDTKVTDQMVKPFADGVRALDASNGGEGAGSMSYIVSSYGIHIIFHAGNATNLIEEDNVSNIDRADLLRKLCTTYTTPESNKSIFNMLYDKLALDSNAYNIKSQSDISTERTKLANNNITIDYYEKNYKDLWS